MAKFNQPVSMKTVNHEGHVAYKMRDKEKLVTQVLTSFVGEQKFYGDNTPDMYATIQSVIKQDPQFVSNLAIFARREFNMRSVAHVLTGFLAYTPEGKPFVRRTVRNVVLRGDDATEILSFYLSTFGKPIPNSLRRSLRSVFATFDAYTLAKYKGEGHAVKMRDVLRITRPHPANDDQSALWKRLLDGTIETPLTWESELSANGNNRETWEKLIDSGKVGYMALLRNLRNIIEADPSNIGKVYEKLTDPEAVRRSRQLPFRFLSAYRNLPPSATSKAVDALEIAASLAVDNLPCLPGKTVIAVDISGSMGCRLSEKSTVYCCDISMLLGLIANRICDESIFYTFNHAINQINLTPHNSMLYTCMKESRCYGGTDLRLPFTEMMQNNIRADRIIIVSDNECNCYGSLIQLHAQEYRESINPDLWVHAIDLQGLGTQQFYGSHTNIVAGWSEKVFEFILLAEAGTDSLMKRIESYNPEEATA